MSGSLSDNTNSCYRIAPEGILCAFWETTLMKMVIGGGGVISFSPQCLNSTGTSVPT